MQELKHSKAQLEQRSNKMSLNRTVIQLREATQELESALQTMHVHTGMLQHQLLCKVLAKKAS